MTRSAPSSPPAPRSLEPAAPSPARKPGVRALVRAVGGPRYVVALAVDSIGAGLLRPFLLLYGIDVLHLAALTAGLAMTAGVVAGLGCMPVVGRWLDRGARSAAVAASMLVRVIGTVLLLAAPAGHAATVWVFAAAALFLGIGGQAVSAAHAALVSTISAGRQRDAALAAGRSVRNAGLGLGALLATASLTGGTAGLRALAAGTALIYLLSAALAYSVRVRASAPPAAAHDSSSRDTGSAPRARRTALPPMRLLLAANVIYVFCLSIPEVALPLVLVTQLHASPVWASAVFVINTGLRRVPGTRDRLDVPFLAPYCSGHLRRRDQRLVPGLPRQLRTASPVGRPGHRRRLRAQHAGRAHLRRKRDGPGGSHCSRARARPCAGAVPAVHRFQPGYLARHHHRARRPRPRRPLGLPDRRHPARRRRRRPSVCGGRLRRGQVAAQIERRGPMS